MRRGRLWMTGCLPLVVGGLLGGCTGSGDDDATSEQRTRTAEVAAQSDNATGHEDNVGTTGDDRTAGDEVAATEAIRVTAEGATPVPDVAPEVPLEELQVDESADDLVAPVVAEQSRALEMPEEVDWDSVVSVADDGLLAAIEVSILEYTELGWTQVGVPELVSSTLLEVDEEAAPPTARVEICVDHDQVDVVDSDGVSMIDSAAEKRVKSILTLNMVDGHWVAIAQDFTDELSC
ncbi:hypothetical protein [Ornithinimicrobium faecis]|uniref:hypothetical protein n=1 Tax=Ornithinimicrobium faecis TaxID=2934158 RepID=UPI00211896E9|nr:hypothetical protein [Ornithinimicrobium sp. HY1745]